MKKPSKDQLDELLTRGVVEVIVKEDLEKKLASGNVLRVKHGVDPTGTELHLGHAVVYRKLRALQDLGHQIVFLIGDYTGRFGDPTDKERARKLRPKAEVTAMAKDYINQLAKIIDIKKAEIRYNSEWYDKWSGEDMLRLLSRFTTDRMLERDMFVHRKKQGKETQYHEPVYPMLQGWDSVELKSNVTVVGSDQKFNELQARKLQAEENQVPQDIIIVPLLVGMDGEKKMSQSLGNYIGLAESHDTQYGKVMSIPDKLILSYFELCTDVTATEIKKIEKDIKSGTNPRDVKMRLAREIVTLYHGAVAARKAENTFIQTFQKHETPSGIKTIRVGRSDIPLIDLLIEANFASSKSEARRLISQGGVKVNDEVIDRVDAIISFGRSGVVLQKGKRHFVRIIS